MTGCGPWDGRKQATHKQRLMQSLMTAFALLSGKDLVTPGEEMVKLTFQRSTLRPYLSQRFDRKSEHF